MSKSISLVAKWLWRFSLVPTPLWHRVDRSKYGVQLNGWDANLGFGVACPWKFISQVYHSFSSMLSLCIGDGTHFRFWEHHWISGSSFHEFSPHLCQVVFNWTK